MHSSLARRRKAIAGKDGSPSTKSRFDWVAITTLITVSVPILYVIGRAYDESYLRVYGLSAELFSRSTQDYLFFALVGIFETVYLWFSSFGKEWQSIIIWAVAISFYMGLLLWLKGSRFKNRLRKGLKDVVESSRLVRIFGILTLGPIVITMGWIICVLLIFFLALPLAIGQKAGEHVAHEEIKQDSGVCAQKVRKDLGACIIVFKDGEKIVTGRLIAASNSEIAIAREGRAIVLSRDKLKLEVQQ